MEPKLACYQQVQFSNYVSSSTRSCDKCSRRRLSAYVACFWSGEWRWDSFNANVLAARSDGARPVLRCSLVSDEGAQCMGVVEFLQDSKAAVAGYRDILHRLNNSVNLGVAGSRVVSNAYRRVRPAWRLSRGPWKSAKFGKMLQDSCGHLIIYCCPVRW